MLSCLFDVQGTIVLEPLACMSSLKETAEKYPVHTTKIINRNVD